MGRSLDADTEFGKVRDNARIERWPNQGRIFSSIQERG